jgi:hypothetical protein
VLRITSILWDYYPRSPRPIHASLLGLPRLVPRALQGFPASSCVAERPDAFFSGGTRYRTAHPTHKKTGPPARDLAIAAGRLDDAGDIAWDCKMKQSLW